MPVALSNRWSLTLTAIAANVNDAGATGEGQLITIHVVSLGDHGIHLAAPLHDQVAVDGLAAVVAQIATAVNAAHQSTTPEGTGQ